MVKCNYMVSMVFVRKTLASVLAQNTRHIIVYSMLKLSLFEGQ